jgi:hypothetical protein
MVNSGPPTRYFGLGGHSSPEKNAALRAPLPVPPFSLPGRREAASSLKSEPGATSACPISFFPVLSTGRLTFGDDQISSELTIGQDFLYEVLVSEYPKRFTASQPTLRGRFFVD